MHCLNQGLMISECSCELHAKFCQQRNPWYIFTLLTPFCFRLTLHEHCSMGNYRGTPTSVPAQHKSTHRNKMFFKCQTVENLTVLTSIVKANNSTLANTGHYHTGLFQQLFLLLAKESEMAVMSGIHHLNSAWKPTTCEYRQVLFEHHHTAGLVFGTLSSLHVAVLIALYNSLKTGCS